MIGPGIKLWMTSPTAFSPASIPGVSFWFDSANAGSVTLNGGDVAQINDLSGQSRHASQGTGSAQPAYSTGGSGINNLGCIAFTGANNDQLTLANGLALAQNVTGFWFMGVFRCSSFATAGRVLSIFNNAGLARFATGFSTVPRLQLPSRRLDADAQDTRTNGSAPPTSTAFFACWQVDYTTGTARFNLDGTALDVSVVSWTADGTNSSNTASSAVPALGRTGANVYTGDMGEMCGGQGILTAVQIETFRTSYFKPKWGTT